MQGQACGEPASSCLLTDLAGESKPSFLQSVTKYSSCSSYLVQEGIPCHGVCPTVVQRVWGISHFYLLKKTGIHDGAAQVKGVPGQHRLLGGVACGSHNWTCGH